MTDNEIIKALECCSNNQHCWLCVLKDREDDCYEILKYALDLINRQKQEIERLTALVEAAEDYLNPFPFKNALDEEIEKTKIEAIKEFAERLKQEDFDHCIDVIYDGSGELNRVEIRRVLFNKQIDELVKEMTESEVKINDK